MPSTTSILWRKRSIGIIGYISQTHVIILLPSGAIDWSSLWLLDLVQEQVHHQMLVKGAASLGTPMFSPFPWNKNLGLISSAAKDLTEENALSAMMVRAVPLQGAHNLSNCMMYLHNTRHGLVFELHFLPSIQVAGDPSPICYWAHIQLLQFSSYEDNHLICFVLTITSIPGYHALITNTCSRWYVMCGCTSTHHTSSASTILGAACSYFIYICYL